MARRVDAADSRGSDARPSLDGTKATVFLGVLSVVLFLDITTKLLVQEHMLLHQQTDLIGTYVRLTYIHNPGAAFGIHLGEHSRWIFLVLPLMALVALGGMYWFTPAMDRLRLVAISLICAGAIGNLIDRIRHAQGVVDFIDVGIGSIRWPVFNVADMAVTTGAVILALSLWREEQRVERGT